MSITTIETQLKAALAAIVTDWPIRWPNDQWPDGVKLSNGLLPINDDGSPRPFVEAERIDAQPSPSIAPAGSRMTYDRGLFRIYLSVGQGEGSTELNTKTDAIKSGLIRSTPYTAPSERLTLMDPRVDDSEAAYEDGDRFVRTITIPWFFAYYS